MKTLILKLSVLVILGSSAFGYGESLVGGASKITDVTVFKDRAYVQRIQSMHFKQGAHTLVFSGITNVADKESFKVKLTNNSKADILGFRIKNEYREKAANPKVRGLEELLKKSIDIKSKITARAQSLFRKDKYLQDMERHYDQSFSLKLHRNKWSPGNFRQFMNFVKSQSGRLHSQWEKLFVEYNKVTRDIERHKALLSELRSPSSKEKLTVFVDLLVKSSGPLKAKLSYMVSQVGWQPVYDLRLNSKGKKGDLEQSALIWQRSGEDWQRVRLKLSNIRSELKPRVPGISSYYLNFRKVGKVKTQVVSQAKSNKKLTAAQSVSTDLGKGVEVNFVIKGQQTILHGLKKTKVFVRGARMSYKEVLQIVPAQFKYAYRQVEMRNPFSWQMAGGTMQIHYDNEFIGQIWQEAVPQRDVFSINAGVDHNLRVTDWTRDKVEEPGIIDRDRHYRRRFMTGIKNYGKKAKKIRVYRQIPLSEMDELKVTRLEKTTKGYIKDKIHATWGYWDLLVPPRKYKELELALEVSAPADFSFSW